MARIRPKVEGVNRKLRRAVASLNAAAGAIRDANLHPKRNIRRVGEALMIIFAILDDVYRSRPDLLPRYRIHPIVGLHEMMPANPALQADGRVGRCAPSRVRR